VAFFSAAAIVAVNVPAARRVSILVFSIRGALLGAAAFCLATFSCAVSLLTAVLALHSVSITPSKTLHTTIVMFVSVYFCNSSIM
jgi:hypothetical protein